MILYILIAAGSVLAAAGVKETQGASRGTRGRAVQWSCLAVIALILMVPAVLRQETGNDYLRYVEFFHLASIDAYVPTEEGFNLLVKVIYTLCGYENYLLVFAVFAVLTIVLMLTALRQQAEDFLFSFFLFMMFGYYYQSFNTMRYYFALSVVMAATIWYIRKNYVIFVLMVLAASLFHKSALAALLLLPLAMHVWKLWQIAAAFAAGCFVTVCHEQVMRLLLLIYSSWEDTTDLAAGTSISWVNIARCAAGMILTGMVLWLQADPAEDTAPAAPDEPGDGTSVKPGAGRMEHNIRHRIGESVQYDAPGGCTGQVSGQSGGKHLRRSRHRRSGLASAQNLQASLQRRLRAVPSEAERMLGGTDVPARSLRLYVNAASLGLAIYVFGWFVPEVSRIAYYLTYTQVFLYPMLIRRIPDRHGKWRRVITIAVIAAAIAYYAMFLRSCYGDTIKLLPYKSFLFHDLNQTPSGSIE